MEGEVQRGQRGVSIQILGSENIRGGRERGNEPCGSIEGGGNLKERYGGRKEGSESGGNIGREVEERILEEEQLAEKEIGEKGGGRKEDMGEGCRDEMGGGGNVTPGSHRRVGEVSEMNGDRMIGMKPEGEERNLQKQEISTK